MLLSSYTFSIEVSEVLKIKPSLSKDWQILKSKVVNGDNDFILENKSNPKLAGIVSLNKTIKKKITCGQRDNKGWQISIKKDGFVCIKKDTNDDFIITEYFKIKSSKSFYNRLTYSFKERNGKKQKTLKTLKKHFAGI